MPPSCLRGHFYCPTIFSRGIRLGEMKRPAQLTNFSSRRDKLLGKLKQYIFEREVQFSKTTENEIIARRCQVRSQFLDKTREVDPQLRMLLRGVVTRQRICKRGKSKHVYCLGCVGILPKSISSSAMPNLIPRNCMSSSWL